VSALVKTRVQNIWLRTWVRNQQYPLSLRLLTFVPKLSILLAFTCVVSHPLLDTCGLES
jgi:hypothetical protein